jgi:hypothetical protein
VAGIFAPQLNEIGAAPSGGGVSADTSVGDLLTNVGSILGAVGRSTGTTTSATQKERDNETLKPFSAAVSKLDKLRPTIGETQFHSRLRSTFKEFVTNNPIQAKEARASALALTGVELGTKEFNLIDEQQEAIGAYVDTNEGQLAMFSVLSDAKDPVTGEIDGEMAFVLLSAAAKASAADKAELDRLNLTQQKEAATTGINENRLKSVIDDRLSRGFNKFQGSAAGLIQAAIDSKAKLDDSTTFLQVLRQHRLAAENELNADATQGGYANHPDYNPSIALAPYDNLITLVQDLGTDAVAGFEALQATDRTTSARFINGAAGFGGTNRDVVSFVSQSMIQKGFVNLEAAVEGMDVTAMREERRGASLFLGTATAVDPDTPPTAGPTFVEEATTVARNLTDDERVQEVSTNIATFGQYGTEAHGGSEKFRSVAVESFGMASAAMNTSRRSIAESTFDKVYDTQFFITYSDIVRHGDQMSANLRAAVAENLATVFEDRVGLVQTRIANDFGSLLPNLGLSIDGAKANIVLRKEKGANTAIEKALLSALAANNLPNTFAGIVELGKADPFNPIFETLNIGLFAGRGQTGEIGKELKYVNKIIGVVDRLPDLSPHLKPQIEKRLSGGIGAAIPVVVDRGGWDALDMGASYYVVDSDGVRHLRIKGEE